MTRNDGTTAQPSGSLATSCTKSLQLGQIPPVAPTCGRIRRFSPRASIIYSAEEARFLENKARTVRNKLLGRITHAASTGNKKLLRKLRHSYFKNAMVKIAALHKAGVRNPSRTAWEAEARFFDPFTPFSEPLNWFPLPKRKGGFRPVCDLAKPLKATHYMIADVIRAQMPNPPKIYNLPGKGREALVSDLRAKLATGCNAFRAWDARDCFSSVNPDALYKLPLPRRIIENALIITNQELQLVAERNDLENSGFIHDAATIGNIQGNGPTGLMQGSPASNLILAYLLRGIPQPDHEDWDVFLYTDDLILVGRADKVLDRVEKKLTEFFGQDRLGPFTLVPKAAGRGGWFEYLGYEFRHDPYRANDANGSWCIDLPQAKWDEMAKEVRREALAFYRANPPWARFDIEGLIARKLRGYPSLTDPAIAAQMLRSAVPDEYELEKVWRMRRSARPLNKSGPSPFQLPHAANRPLLR